MYSKLEELTSTVCLKKLTGYIFSLHTKSPIYKETNIQDRSILSDLKSSIDA